VVGVVVNSGKRATGFQKPGDPVNPAKKYAIYYFFEPNKYVHTLQRRNMSMYAP